jgi:hypothetical protein
MKKINLISVLILISLFTVSLKLVANYKGEQNKKGNKPTLQKTMDNPFQSLLNINNATMWVTEEGFHDWVVASGWNGAFPNGTTVGAIFAEGIVWGGLVNDGSQPVVRVNGNTYGTGCAPVTRLYRVRPDYLTGNLTSDAASFNNISIGSVTEADVQALRNQYAIDWNEWPANEGAPYKDVNNSGSYEPGEDIPGIPGASQTLFIKYNDNLSTSNYGSPPIGLEIAETYWAYAYSGALGNVIYKKVDIVYKGTPTSASNSRIDSMYIVQWADPDVGNSTDDFAGCDTSLNLGYAYSSGATDATYAGLGLAPPAVGYDFLQGVSIFTGNPNDSAIFNLQWRKGYKYVNRKPMSAYSYFAAGGAWSDPDFDYNGTLEFYNLMRGFRPIPRYPNASPFPPEVADVTSDGTFLLTGDPVAGTGKLDGSAEGPGDRRIMVTNGPVTLKLGDTAQVVLGLVYGLGTDNKSSVAALKQNDLTAQIVFDQLFKLPSIDPPNVQIANLDKKIVLNWGSNSKNTENIESFSDQNYTFEGYEVYQLPSSSSALEDGILLGTFDLINHVTAIYDTVIDLNGASIPVLASDGKDKGLQRYLVIDNDKFRGTALRNGQEYYFAVVSYAYNPAPLLPFHVLRSAFIVLTTVPQTPAPGVRYSNVVGDTILTVHSGPSDGKVTALIVDPTKVTGHKYEVTFKDDGGSIKWDVTDVSLTPPVVKASNLSNQGGGDDYPIVDGLLIKTEGPPLLGVSFTSSGDRWLSGNEANGGELMFGAAFLGPNFWGETTVPPGELKDVHIDAFKVESYIDANSNGKYDIGEIYTVNPDRGQIANLYQTWGPGNWRSSSLIPFKVFDVTSNPPRQLSVIIRDRNNNGQWDPDDGSTTPFNYFFVLDSDYDPTGNNWNPTAGGRDFMDEIVLNGGPVLWTFWWVPRGTREQFAADFTMDFVAPKVNTANDKFTFTAPLNSNSQELAKLDVEKINVFPNPYYGYQYREIAPDNKYVTFSHLPENAIIRIFDISGVLVRTINHVSTSGQFETWNLQNDNNYPVASGIYIVYIDMPDLGKQKILKLAVIQEQQILKVY